ncbi:hypothetical protein [Niallia nealsonii]|uniref:Uncharacterized protein n=1 Tax=Niallia nealsonii TaxID=115979 RepID=A0A2N0YWI3_9BACI|nr:hypothetical protein [Niallia nealsonii]PKG21618.1 hypothetical protein CWS01_21515 [Niallia nealsonii]
MSDYQQFLQERDQIDFYLQKGYYMKNIIEDLNGTTVEFSNKQNNSATIYLTTANARKYFSVKLIEQRKNCIVDKVPSNKIHFGK